MQLSLNEDQAMLAKTAGAFVTESASISRLRTLRDSHDERGYSRDIWKQMAELGWLAIPFSERDGGMDMGLAGAIIVSEALGRGLSPEPYLASVCTAGQALALAGNAEQRKQWLAPMIEGDKLVAFAHSEAGQRYSTTKITTRAERKNAGFRISGQKLQVQAGFLCDAYVVSARTAGDDGAREGLSLFLVPKDAPGLRVTRQWRIDSRNAAIVELSGVEVPRSALLGSEGEAADVIENVIDRATVALCGEMLGGMSEAFARTLEYLKQRKQFGVLIGTFQALKHRAARMFIEIELARSATLAAARALDAASATSSADAKIAVAVAKARCSDAYTQIANEAVQMHGGIGMTDEHDIGLFMKHARACELTFGDAAFQRERYAQLNGY